MDAEQSKAEYIARRAPEIMAQDAADFAGNLTPEVQRQRAESVAGSEWRSARCYEYTSIVAVSRSGWSGRTRHEFDLQGHSCSPEQENGPNGGMGQITSLPFSYAELLEIRDQINYIEACRRAVDATRALRAAGLAGR